MTPAAVRSLMAMRSCRGNDHEDPTGYGGSAGCPARSPPVRHTARSHGLAFPGPNRSTQARTASVIASTASPSSLPAGATAPISRSSATTQRDAHARKLAARSLLARSQPRTVPAGRSSRRAITRCPTPPAAKRSASPITSVPSRRRGTSHPGASTCVVSHARQRVRRGLTDRTPSSSRTSRERANPHGDSGLEQRGHASSPAASAASTPCGVIAIESIEDGQPVHHRRSLPAAVNGGKGRLVLQTYHNHASCYSPTPPRRPRRERREEAISCRY